MIPTRDEILIGLDVGTSAADACAYASDGRLIASASTPIATTYPRRGWAEQDARTWRSASFESLRTLTRSMGDAADRVPAIGLTGQCPSLTLVDSSGAPLTAGVIHQDMRAVDEAEMAATILGSDRIAARTGAVLTHYHIAPRLMWLARHCTALRPRHPWLAQPRDTVAQSLTGNLCTDYTHAGCTGLFDLAAVDWAYDWLDKLDLGWVELPPMLAPSVIAGIVTRQAAAETGLRAGLPVVIGAADNFCADLAMGAITPGVLGDTTGTTTCLDLTITQSSAASATPSPALSLYVHFQPRMLYVDAGLNTTGAVIAWAAKALAGGDVDRLDAMAASAPRSADSALLLPFLAGGERTHAGASGVWLDLTLSHDPAHLARSVFEGTTFALRELLDEFRAAGYPVAEARLGGGGSRSHFWNRLKADVWKVPIRAALSMDASALGAALLAGIAAGLYRDAGDAVARAARLGPVVEPDREAGELYDYVYDRWRRHRLD